MQGIGDLLNQEGSVVVLGESEMLDYSNQVSRVCSVVD